MPYQITQPCSEDWSKMQPVKGGRFCDKCRKKVHDLTSGESLPNISGGICGRIHREFVQNISFTHFIRRQKPVAWFFIFVLLLFSKIGKSQSGRNVEIKDAANSQTPPDSIGKRINISGVLTDKKTKEEIPFATVIAYDENNRQMGAAQTDLDGKYSLQLNNITGKSISIKAVYLGYQSMQINDIPVNSLKKIINIKLSSDGVILGEIITGALEFNKPLIDPFGSTTMFDREDFLHHPKG